MSTVLTTQIYGETRCNELMEERAFLNRRVAGEALGSSLREAFASNAAVLGLARGGVVVAEPVAEILGAPLEVMVARKIGAPTQRELGIGAVAPGGVTVRDERLIGSLSISDKQFDHLSEVAHAELGRRLSAYLDGRMPLDIQGKDVILVDDGLATGVTALAAARSVRLRNPRSITFAAPVCSSQGSELVGREVDRIFCLRTPDDLVAVGYWYEDFSQTSDEEVQEILRRSARRVGSAG